MWLCWSEVRISTVYAASYRRVARGGGVAVRRRHRRVLAPPLAAPLLPTSRNLSLLSWLLSRTEHTHAHTYAPRKKTKMALPRETSLVPTVVTLCIQASRPRFISQLQHIYIHQGLALNPHNSGHYHIVALSSKHPAITKPTHTTNTRTCMHYLLTNPRITPRYPQDPATMQTHEGG